MLKKTDKLLIGKDISRDAQVVAGAGLKTISASTGMAEGEIVVLDKYKKVLAAGATIVDTDSIFICQGTGETFAYTNEAGTLTSSNRKLIFSDIIQGSQVKRFLARSYTAKAEATSQIDLTGMTPVVGTEYVVNVIYKDIKERPAPFIQTYRYISTTAVLATFLTALVAKVNAHSGRRVTATDEGGDIFKVTGLPIPDCTSGLTDIDKFVMVEFDMYVNQVNTKGNQETINDGITSDTITTTAPVYGSGNWEQVRDVEKLQLGHIGISNKTQFPVIQPDMSTVKNATYELIVIEHDKSYLAPNNVGTEYTPLTTVVAIPVESAGTQLTTVVGKLNAWMASCPGAFANISF